MRVVMGYLPATARAGADRLRPGAARGGAGRPALRRQAQLAARPRRHGRGPRRPVGADVLPRASCSSCSFSLKAGWCPTSGRGGWEHLVLPALTLGAFAMASIARLTRSAVLEVLRAGLRAHRAGQGRVRAGWWSSSTRSRTRPLPIVTITGLQFGTLLGGAVVTETVFAWPGIGRLAIQSIYNRDYPVVQCTVFLSALRVHRRQLRHRRDLWRPRSPRPSPLRRCGGRGAGRAAARRAAHAAARRGRRGLRAGAGRRGRSRRRGSRRRIPRGSRCAAGWRRRRWRRRRPGPPARHRSPRPRRALARDLGRARVAAGRLRGGGRGRPHRRHARASWPATAAAGLDSVIMTLADAQLAFPFILLAIGIIAVLGPVVSHADRGHRALGLDELRARAALAGAGAALARVRGRHPRPRRLGGRASSPATSCPTCSRRSSSSPRSSWPARSCWRRRCRSSGLGIQPPTPSWGGMVHEGREYLDSRVVDLDLPRACVLMLTSLVGQPHRRLAARPARSDAAGGVARWTSSDTGGLAGCVPLGGPSTRRRWSALRISSTIAEAQRSKKGEACSGRELPHAAGVRLVLGLARPAPPAGGCGSDPCGT